MATPAESADQILYKPEEAATVLRIGRSMVYEQIRLGRLRSITIGRRRLVPPEYVAEYIALLKRESQAAA
ncbi:helix-turn-helix domain-containing protein [Streptomyces vinaceus]|uniref:helix-turn-helix domain-containing protein n=1 Tax=Streptomyces vinaceus TaxID=1960 RepID=UPI0037F250F0